jgi:hypothetical protein
MVHPEDLCSLNKKERMVSRVCRMLFLVQPGDQSGSRKKRNIPWDLSILLPETKGWNARLFPENHPQALRRCFQKGSPGYPTNGGSFSLIMLAPQV